MRPDRTLLDHLGGSGDSSFDRLFEWLKVVATTTTGASNLSRY
jgi:hypothetical protein